MTNRIVYEDTFVSLLKYNQNKLKKSSFIDILKLEAIEDLYNNRFEILELNSLIKNNLEDQKTSVDDKNISIFILGAGGVTSWLLPQLLKVLYNYQQKNTLNFLLETPIYNIYLVDGDTVENKNLLRQNFISEDVGINKAKVLSQRYNNIYENINVKFIDKYVYSSNFFLDQRMEIPQEFQNEDLYLNLDEYAYLKEDHIFNLVDNELTKHMIDFLLSTRLYRINPLKKPRYWSVGCDVYHGTVFSCAIGSTFYSLEFQETSFVEEDSSIHQESCAEIAETQTIEQSFDSNGMGANILTTLFSNYLANPNNYSTLKVDFTSTSQPVLKTTFENYGTYDSLYELYSKVYREKIVGYLSKYSTFRDAPVGKKYKEIYTFLLQYIDLPYKERDFDTLENSEVLETA